jgi:hypothetical protein
LGALSTMQEYFPSSPPFSPPSPLTTTPNVSDALSYGYHAVILWTELFVSSLPVLRSAVTKPSMLIRINTLTFFRAWLYVPAFNDSYNGGTARCGKHHRTRARRAKSGVHMRADTGCLEGEGDAARHAGLTNLRFLYCNLGARRAILCRDRDSPEELSVSTPPMRPPQRMHPGEHVALCEK